MTLPITRKWFDMILAGEKKEEYREIKPYWRIRIAKALGLEKRLMVLDMILDMEPQELEVKFRNGYGRNAPELIANCIIRIGAGKPEWGAAEGEEYYIFGIKKLVWNSFTKRGGTYKQNESDPEKCDRECFRCWNMECEKHGKEWEE